MIGRLASVCAVAVPDISAMNIPAAHNTAALHNARRTSNQLLQLCPLKAH
jgi:hypothetical protein